MTIFDKEMLDSINSDFYITKRRIYLNNGSISPLPISSIKSMTDFNIRYSEVGPDSKEFTIIWTNLNWRLENGLQIS